MGMGNVRVAKVGVGLVSWGRGLTWVSEVGKGGWGGGGSPGIR